jgi:hypothetical protein
VVVCGEAVLRPLRIILHFYNACLQHRARQLGHAHRAKSLAGLDRTARFCIPLLV